MPRASVIPLLIAVLPMILAPSDTARARNSFDYFTKAPTFDPPENCEPGGTHYGVLAECIIRRPNGANFWASMDTAVGWFQEEGPDDAKRFARDHVAEAKDWWNANYPKVDFRSEATTLKPTGAPKTGIDCFRYSIKVENVPDDQDQNVFWTTQVEGLACAWRVEERKPGKQTIELFWLEVFDSHHSQEKPLPNFQDLASQIFRSTRI
jgi:hypothetical protein